MPTSRRHQACPDTNICVDVVEVKCNSFLIDQKFRAVNLSAVVQQIQKESSGRNPPSTTAHRDIASRNAGSEYVTPSEMQEQDLTMIA
jgi:hypothetical protein